MSQMPVSRIPTDNSPSGLSGVWGARPPHPVLLVLTAVTSVVMAIPLIYVLIRAVQGGLPVWLRLWQTGHGIPRLLLNSVKLAGTVTVLSLLIAVPLAWLVVRTDLPGRRLWRWMAAVPIVYPSFIGAFAYITVFGPRGLLETWLGRWLDVSGQAVRLPSIYGLGGTSIILALFTYPYLYLLVAGALRNLNRNLEESARACGLTPVQVFFRVILPLIRPAIGAGSLLISFHALAEFGTVAMLRYDTFTSSIYMQLVGRYDRSAAAALSVVLVALTIALVAAELRWERQARYYQTDRGWRPPEIIRLGRWRYPALAFAALVMLASAGIPAALLFYWSWRALQEGAASGLLGYAWNTISTSGLAATAATILAFPIAYLASRSPGPASRLVYRLAFAGYALPGVVIALAMIFLFNTYLPWFYGTLWVLVTSYIVRFLPETLGAQHSSLAQVSPSLEEAARSCGRSTWSVFRHVTIPLTLPGIISGWSIVLLNCLKELPATLLLRPAGHDTLAVRLWIYASEGFYTAGALPGLLLVLLALPPLVLLMARVLEGRTSLS